MLWKYLYTHDTDTCVIRRSTFLPLKLKVKIKKKIQHPMFIYPKKQTFLSLSKPNFSHSHIHTLVFSHTHTHRHIPPINLEIFTDEWLNMGREWGATSDHVPLVLWLLLRPTLRRGIRLPVRRFAGMLVGPPRISVLRRGIDSRFHRGRAELRAGVRLPR